MTIVNSGLKGLGHQFSHSLKHDNDKQSSRLLPDQVTAHVTLQSICYV